MKLIASFTAGVAAATFLFLATDSREVNARCDGWTVVIPDDEPLPRYVDHHVHCVNPADVIGLVD